MGLPQEPLVGAQGSEVGTQRPEVGPEGLEPVEVPVDAGGRHALRAATPVGRRCEAGVREAERPRSTREKSRGSGEPEGVRLRQGPVRGQGP